MCKKEFVDEMADKEFIERVCKGDPTHYDELIMKAAKAEFELVTKGMPERQIKVYKTLLEIRCKLMLCGGLNYKEIEEIVHKNLLP